MYHFMSVELANSVGAYKALLLTNIHFWWKNNKDNNRNFYEGRYWTFNSAKAFQKQFSYMSEKKIARLLSELERDGFLISGCFNKMKLDRTKWYTLSDKLEAFFNAEESIKIPE